MAQLDALRAFAVLGVFAQHALTERRAVALLAPGQYGVILFFVLSGYLITGILLRCRDLVRGGQPLGLTVRRFYARRFLRIFPLFYFVLVAAAALDIHPMRETFWWHATYLSNLYFVRHGEWNGPVSPFWSLALEEQFYLVWPWVVLSTPPARLGRVLVALLVLCPAARWLYVHLGVASFSVGLLPLGNADYLFVGALLAHLQHRGAAADRGRRVLGWVGVVAGPAVVALNTAALAGALSPRFHALNAYVQMYAANAAVGLLCFRVVDGASTGFRGLWGDLLSARPLCHLGTISYGVYVYHTFLFVVLAWLTAPTCAWLPCPASDLGWLPWRLLATLVVASVSWRFFERPINALKRRFPYVADRVVADVSVVAPAV